MFSKPHTLYASAGTDTDKLDAIPVIATAMTKAVMITLLFIIH
jgi:hypothetical protein